MYENCPFQKVFKNVLFSMKVPLVHAVPLIFSCTFQDTKNILVNSRYLNYRFNIMLTVTFNIV